MSQITIYILVEFYSNLELQHEKPSHCEYYHYTISYCLVMLIQLLEYWSTLANPYIATYPKNNTYQPFTVFFLYF